MAATPPSPDQTPQPQPEPGLRRVDAAARWRAAAEDVARDGGDLAYRYPVPSAVSAGVVAAGVIGALPIIGSAPLELVAGVAAGFVTHRFVTRYSGAADRAAAAAAEKAQRQGPTVG